MAFALPMTKIANSFCAFLTRAPDNLGPRIKTRHPHGSDCFHEIKYDGYRLRVERNGDRVRLITRGAGLFAERLLWL